MLNMKIPPLIDLPPNRVWRTYPGGKVLDKMEGKPQPADDHFPEDWIGSTTRATNIGREHLEDEGLATVEIDGQQIFLKSLCEDFADDMLGAHHVATYGTTTYFLLKFLDSAIRLHIQCHPTIPFAQKFLNSNSGKTEAYVILGFRDEVKDPYIYMGFQHPPEQEEFKQIIEEQDIDKLLACFEKIPVRAGDVFLVPGGYPHAIGEGVFMIELMEPTDLVARIEFERGGYVLPEASRFMDRGIDFALSMFDFSSVSQEQVRDNFFCNPSIMLTQGKSEESVLIDESRTPCFRLNELKVDGSYQKVSDSFYIAIVTEGAGTASSEGQTVQLKQGSRFFVPAKTDEVLFESDSTMKLVLALPPLSN